MVGVEKLIVTFLIMTYDSSKCIDFRQYLRKKSLCI